MRYYEITGNELSFQWNNAINVKTVHININSIKKENVYIHIRANELK